MLKRIVAFLLLNAFLVCQMVSSQTQASPSSTSESSTVIHAITREVLLDLVIRDKHHHIITDIRPDEVQVYEDGVRQKITAFRNVEGAEQLRLEQNAAERLKNNTSNVTTSTAANLPTNSSQNRLEQMNFVSIVFAQIAPLDMEFAHQAVLEFLKSDTLPNTYVTVYSLGYNLHLVQPYTSDKATLTKAVDTAVTGIRGGSGLDINAQAASGANAAAQATASNLLADTSLGPAQAAAIQDAALNPLPTIAADPMWMRNAASQDVSVTLGSALLTQAALVKGLRFAESLSNGMNSMDALHGLVQSQEKLPGRKVVIYLADGLTFPVNRRDMVDQLISFANRSGVSFYTVDTRGLNAEDPMAKSLAEQERTGAESSVSRVEPRTAIFEDDDNHLAATSNDQLAMRELADSTGGFAVTNTNQIADPMQRVMEDIRTHYELAYTPISSDYDGHFRKIEVRISRPKVTVQTRSGYFALPELNGQPVQPFEMAALKALDATSTQPGTTTAANATPAPTPQVFPYELSPVKFRSTPDGVNYEVAFEVPVSSLSIISDAKTGKARLQLSVLALVRNSNGEIISKISRDLTREMANSEIPQLATDRIVYAEPLQLGAGHYVIDSAVTDELANKTSVKRIAVSVEPGKDLALSSVEVVRRFIPLNGPRNPQDPYELASARVLPTFTDSVASGKPMALYFVVYPAKLGAGEAPKVTLEMLHDGKEVGLQPLTLPKPDVDGSIPVLMQLSPAKGKCDIVVTAQQGTLAAQSTLSVQIE